MSNLAIFRKHEACGQTALPDMSLLKGQKWWKCDIFSYFQTMCRNFILWKICQNRNFFWSTATKIDFQPLCQTNNYFVGVFYILWINLASFSCTSRAFQWSSQVFTYLFPYLIYPLNSITFCASIFTTVALAFERHTAVCRPIHYRNVTATNSVRRRTLW